MAVLHVLFVIALTFTKTYSQEDATVIVRGSMQEAETDDRYICATIDWWPSNKCNYNHCPWGQTSVLNLDVNHPTLLKAIKAFNSLRIRIGGSLQDQVRYGVSSSVSPCTPFQKKADGLFGFSEGCLTMVRWDELNILFKKAKATLIFGLNALEGRHPMGNGVWEGSWNSTNAQKFIEYTVSKGYQVDSWEFGNELAGRGIGARVSAELYAKDVIALRTIIDQSYKNSKSHPLLVAPGGFYDQQWYAKLLKFSGPNIVNALTHHIYNIGAGNDPHLTENILNPNHLSYAQNTFRDLELTIERHGPWSSAWVGEAGGAYNSGGKHVSNTFINSFWYLDQLGMAAKYNTKVYCRQSLVGGNYGLLNTTTFAPNPDFYSALLWHQLMGKKVLPIDISGSTNLRAYAHCAKQRAGIALLLINLSNSTGFNVAVRNDLNVILADGGGVQRGGAFIRGLKKAVSWVGRRALIAFARREEYHLTANDGDYTSQSMLLNGIPLELTENGDIPTMRPKFSPLNLPINVAPLSIAFLVFPNFEAQVCA